MTILLILFSLVGCSPSIQEFETPPTPTATKEPTKTPTPEPTRAPSFVEVFPPTIQRCKAENNVAVANMGEGIEKILAMEKDLGLTMNDAAKTVKILMLSMEQSKSQRPNAFSIQIVRGYDGNDTFKPSSCFHLTFPDGGEAYVVGVPIIITPKDDQLVFLHFAVDPSATKKMLQSYDQQGLPYGWNKDQQNVDIFQIYSKLHSGSFKSLHFAYLLSDPSLGPDGGCAPYWGNMRSLRDTNMERDFYYMIGQIEKDSFLKLPTAKKENIRSQIQRFAIPTIGIYVQ